MLTTQRKIHILGEACNGEEAIEMLQSGMSPDLIIMDVSLPGMNGIDATRRIKSQNESVKILVLSMYDNPTFVHQAMEAGASGYILKKSMVEELNTAIDTVMAGKRYLSLDITQNIDPDLNLKKDSYKSLTDRELEVFERLANGASVKDIADELVVSIYTVYTHISNIKRKIGVEKTADIMRYAIENPLILGSSNRTR